MSADVGTILDKYELIERVGQGGMAIVYRGLDRTLRREVAVKVLHTHLAESDEARSRFEREAQAVAKLRHENILEIFDFSGTRSPESYIVTEFIDGQTLKEFISEHDIRYPEIGAMITLQVCRALGHAHSLGILHRDVKPENIMIRNDGVVKLTDFGIAQMLDLQRMTVTGQLLGSPAYMSPEHVEGKRLDFRTDVFSAGILLYQLVTGKLPFRGRNPHEVLKRIADCKYTEAHSLNPLVGNQLTAIIHKALAREKDDRYADVSLMLQDLERYLSTSGLTDYREELARFFAAPVAYEMALRPRLLAELTRRGKDLLDTDRVGALELFNRVLTVDPDHADVLAIIDRLSRRRRGLRMAALAGGIVAIAALALIGRAYLGRESATAAPATPSGGAASLAATHAAADAAPATAPPLARAHAAATDAAPPLARARRRPQRNPRAAARDGHPHHAASHGPRHIRGAHRAAPPDAAAATRRFVLRVFPPTNSEYRIGSGPWQKTSSGTAKLALGAGKVVITARNRACCEEESKTVTANTPPGPIAITLGYLPAHIIARCNVPGVSVEIGKRPAQLGQPEPVFFNTSLGTRTVAVVFVNPTSSRLDRHHVRVHYNQSKQVTCAF